MTFLSTLVCCLIFSVSQAETLWTPYVGITAIGDDNIRFSGTAENKEDDYIYVAIPGLKLDYDQELTKLATDANVIIRRYQENNDFDDEVYRFDLDGRTRVSERFGLRGKYEFRKDTTLDSELDETGRILTRESRLSHDALLAPNFNLTERANIGLTGRYRRVVYESDDNVDYSVAALGVPMRWRLSTQVDTIYVYPGYSFRDSDVSNSDSFSFRLGWDHETTERLTVDISAGVRYTELERIETDEFEIETVVNEENWGAVGNIELRYVYPTADFELDFRHGLRNTADGNQVTVTRVIALMRWRFSERAGMSLEGRYYYTQDEGANDDDTTQFALVRPELYYRITENHLIFIDYEFSQEKQQDSRSEPDAERHRVWAGIRLNFPLI